MQRNKDQASWKMLERALENFLDWWGWGRAIIRDFLSSLSDFYRMTLMLSIWTLKLKLITLGPSSSYSDSSRMHFSESFPRVLMAAVLMRIFLELVLLDLEILNIGGCCWEGWWEWVCARVCSSFLGRGRSASA